MVQPLVSLITPVYNGEPYLDQCIASVLAQTYTHWDYLIVNNCSTDRSLEIAERYAAADSRIRVHNNDKFLPQLSNFNLALNVVSRDSAYYKIVLADDWIFPECLERMIALAEENPSVGIVSSYQLAGTEVVADGLPFPSTVVSGRDICRAQVLGGHFFFGSPTSLLVRGDVVRQRKPFFNEAALHADTDACYAILRDWDFGFVHQVLTFKRTDNESISSALRHLEPHPLDKFISLVSHGRHFLNPDEFDAVLRAFTRRYFRLLSRGLFYPHGRARYQYHQVGLRSIGYELSLIKLWPHILYALASMAVHPTRTALELFRGLKRVLRSFRGRRQDHRAVTKSEHARLVTDTSVR